jgi:hypothetical protein
MRWVHFLSARICPRHKRGRGVSRRDFEVHVADDAERIPAGRVVVKEVPARQRADNFRTRVLRFPAISAAKLPRPLAPSPLIGSKPSLKESGSLERLGLSFLKNQVDWKISISP